MHGYKAGPADTVVRAVTTSYSSVPNDFPSRNICQVVKWVIMNRDTSGEASAGRKESIGVDAVPKCVSLAMCADALGVSVSALKPIVARGDLKSIRIGRRRLVPIGELHAYIEAKLRESA